MFWRRLAESITVAYIIAFLLAAIIFALTLNPAHAAPQCGNHDDIAATLATKYGEALQSIGLAQDGTVMELYASPEAGTWTLTVTLPTGQTCLVAAGRGFQTVKPGEPA